MEASSPSGPFVAGELIVYPEEFLVLAAGRRLPLTAYELGVLVAFMQRSGRIVSREELYAAVWRAPLRSGDRSVDVYVRRLRRKLATELPEWRFIHTHVGFGYRFGPERANPYPPLRSQHLHTVATDR
jgi:DNA-binding response OmpR family regulator